VLCFLVLIVTKQAGAGLRGTIGSCDSTCRIRRGSTLLVPVHLALRTAVPLLSPLHQGPHGGTSTFNAAPLHNVE
jgi:hypothetical protein